MTETLKAIMAGKAVTLGGLLSKELSSERVLLTPLQVDSAQRYAECLLTYYGIEIALIGILGTGDVLTVVEVR